MSNFTLDAFQLFRRVLCVCPHCGDILRLSDLHLKYKGKAEKTWLDTYEFKVSKLEKKEEKFDEKEDELREKSHEKGRKKVPKIINKSLDPSFVKLKYNPYDIKAVLHPIDFVVFNGMENEDLKDIVLLSKNIQNVTLNTIRQSVKSIVDKRLYDWKVARITMEGKLIIE